MPSLKRAFKYLLHNKSQFYDSILTNYFRFLPDKWYLSLKFRCRMGYWINWKNPKTFSEKLQWLKLYNRKPEYTMMVDKYAVKEYVKSIIGEEYVIPTLGAWEHFDDIDFRSLPNKFVLKTTNGGGSTGVVICKDKSNIEKQHIRKLLESSLRSNIYNTLREWPYKNVRSRIIAEELLQFPDNSDLYDYKFFCFNGVPSYCQVISGRGNLMSIDFFDVDWKHQPFHEPKTFPFAKITPGKPVGYELMLSLASQLAKSIPFVRIDFYNINGKIYFGEITFFPTSGFGGFSPNKWDEEFGRMIKLPENYA